MNRSDAKQDSSRTVQETARLILRHLRDNAEGASKEALAARGVELVSVAVSTPTEISDGIRGLLSRNVDAVVQVSQPV